MRKKYNIILISILVAMFIEIFIFNYGFFRTNFMKSKNIEPEFNIDNKKIMISDIDERITSINFIYENELTDKITYTLSFIAEESSDQLDITPKIMLENDNHYINFDTHSKCKYIEVDLLTETNLNIEKIILNHPNININLVRIIILFMIIFFVIEIKKGDICKKEYDRNSKKQNWIFLINLATICGFIILYVFCQFDSEEYIIKREEIDKEDSILMQTEAILNRQIELTEEPSEELKNMENPYDSTKRDAEGVSYLYDVAYYNGNYYNYFGIAPILTSILPFRAITGVYTHTYIFNLVYVVIAIFALYFLYRKLINRYINKISLLNFHLGFYAILLGSNFLTVLRGAKYDIVVTSGIAFLLISLNLAMSIFSNNKSKIFKLILLGITTALVVLSKPNLIIYYVLILFFVLISMKALSIKEKILNGLWSIIPLGIFAIFQMILNYMRFDSIFEFGAKYQLTGFNMISCMSITFGKILAGFSEYILKTPTINPLKFPFIFANTDTRVVSVNELCYENRLIGLIAIPILYGYFIKSFVIKKSENKELYWFLNLCIITSVLSIILNTCFGGICEAYSIDFKLILSIGAVIILLKWLEKNETNEIINRIFLLLCIVTILIMIPLSLTTEKNFLTDFGSDTTVYLENLFEFWC